MSIAFNRRPVIGFLRACQRRIAGFHLHSGKAPAVQYDFANYLIGTLGAAECPYVFRWPVPDTGYLKNILRNIRPTLLLLRQDASSFGGAFFPDGQPLGYALAVRLVDWSDGGEIIFNKPLHIIKVQQDGAGDTVA